MVKAEEEWVLLWHTFSQPLFISFDAIKRTTYYDESFASQKFSTKMGIHFYAHDHFYNNIVLILAL